MTNSDGAPPEEFSQGHFYEEGAAGGMHSSEVDEFLASPDSTFEIRVRKTFFWKNKNKP